MGKRLTYEYVKSYIESESYSLLSDSYTNNYTKLLVKCPMGHEYKVTFGNFKRGRRCDKCLSLHKSHDYVYVKSFIESEKYKLVDDVYINAFSKLSIICPEGHEYKVKFNNFQQGQRCIICNGTKILTYEYVKSYIESFGYTLLSDSYVNYGTKLLIRCPEGHEYGVIFGNFKAGHRCSQCWVESKSSRAEREVQDLVKSMIPGVICNDRTQIVNPLTGWNLELDIWIPSMRKAIEYNGLHWHNDSYVKIKDTIKLEQCRKLDIDLLVIEDVEWINNNTTCKNNLFNFLKG